MKKKILYGLLFLVVGILAFGLTISYLPFESIVKQKSVTEREAVSLRENLKSPYETFTTSDGETLFLRRWNPDTINELKKDMAVLIFHGITAHSGAYDMAGKPFSKAGYTTFGFDLRGYGLSGGNRGDAKGKEQWISDMTEAVAKVKSLGFPKVIIMGHSLGVASAIYTAKAIPNELTGLILLSGAYEGKPKPEGSADELSLFKKARIIASSVFRPSFPVVEYYRKGMTGTGDPLFNFKYTLRFMTMMDKSELHLPESLQIPVLVSVGDKDELFDVDKVKDLYDAVPSKKKEFIVLKDTYHAKFPDQSWAILVDWMDRSFG
jgi:acylglycerol lipase